MNIMEEMHEQAMGEFCDWWTSLEPQPGMPLLMKLGGTEVYLVRPRPKMRLRNIVTGDIHVIQSVSLANKTMTLQKEGGIIVPDQLPIVIDSFWIVVEP